MPASTLKAVQYCSVKLAFDGLFQEISDTIGVIGDEARCKHELSFNLRKSGPERITTMT